MQTTHFDWFFDEKIRCERLLGPVWSWNGTSLMCRGLVLKDGVVVRAVRQESASRNLLPQHLGCL